MPKHSVHVRSVYLSDPKDPLEENGVLVRLEIWPIPAREGIALMKELESIAKARIREFGWSGSETDLTSKGKGH